MRRFTILSVIVLTAAVAHAATPIPLDLARRTFADVRIALEDDGGRLWGKTLDGPILLVDPESRFVVANGRDAGGMLQAADGVYTGTLPNDVVIANTATNWSGTRWTMVMWNSISRRSVPRRRLLIHESFHRIQDDLGFPASIADNPHLDTLDGRYWYLLELRALSLALRSDDRSRAIADALAFRAQRRSMFPGAATAERTLENNEGLAEYTGFVLRGTSDEETRLAIARRLETTDRGESFVRSFAYSTGPAYGLLLDVLAPEWRHGFTASADLGDTLARLAKITPSPDAKARAADYAGALLRAEEENRAREQQVRVAGYRARLVTGPVIEIPADIARYAFDPYTVVPLGDDGTVYPTLEVSGSWGTVATESGARMSRDHKMIYIGVADRDRMKLEPGWKLRQGTRPADLTLEAPPKQ